ncbi:type VI secretion system tube protein TssD [Flavobacterium sp. PS2]
MSFLPKLHIDGEEYNVLEFNINFRQEIDSISKPTGNAKVDLLD